MCWFFWIVVLEKTLESPLDCKVIQPVHPKADQSWVFIGRTDAEVETPILWPPHAKSWLIWKDPDAGRDSGQEKGTTEEETVGWHHRLDGHGFGWTPGVGDGQGGLACCDSWSHKELDKTEQLNWTEVMDRMFVFLLKSIYLHPSPSHLRWCYLEMGPLGGNMVNGISALRDQRKFLCLAPCEDTARKQLSMIQETESTIALVFDFQPP